MSQFAKIIDEYISWIKNNTEIRSIADDKYAEITTPFLDRHNDHVVIYAKKEKEKIILTDDGYTVNDLRVTGFELSSPKRKKFFDLTLRGFGVLFVEKTGEMLIEATTGNVGQKKHALLQAILAINDMHTLSQENVFSFFKEDVERFFTSNKIYFTKDVRLIGKTGFDHNVDFLIPASQTKPERLIKTLNIPKKDPAMAMIFAFTDILNLREEQTPTQSIIIYNDEQEKNISSDILSAFSNYGVQGIPWSKRTDHVKDFSMA